MKWKKILLKEKKNINTLSLSLDYTGSGLYSVSRSGNLHYLILPEEAEGPLGATAVGVLEGILLPLAGALAPPGALEAGLFRPLASTPCG